MFIVEINSNQLINAGQIPTNRRDHVGVPKFEVTTRVSTHSVTGTGSGSRENTLAKTFQSPRCFTSSCSFKVHKTFPRITVNKLPRLPPASISYSSAISLFLRKNLGEKRLYSKIFQWPTACFQQLRHEPDVVSIIDSVTQG